jgi:hypothetical protein
MVNGINDFIFTLLFYKNYLYGKQQRLQTQDRRLTSCKQHF